MGNTVLAARITRYGIVGVMTNLFGYLIFLAFLSTNMLPVLATGITYLIIVAAGYYANRRWAFRSGSTHSRDVPRYLLAYGIGLIVALGVMQVVSMILHPAIAQIIAIILAAIAIYCSLEILRFGKSGTNNDN